VTVVWFSWKDIRHPLAGGAERVGHEWRRRLARDGHVVRHLTAQYPGSAARETIDGVDTLRRGRTLLGHYPAALHAYRGELHADADLIVEEVNTVPYFTRIVRGRAHPVLLYYQLAREIWRYQTPAPVAAIGYVAEAVYTRPQGRGHPTTITISDDSKRDLMTVGGFDAARVHVVRVGIDNEALAACDPAAKAGTFTVLFHGSLRAMKRPLQAVAAFEALLAAGADGRLWISGSGDGEAALREYVQTHELGDHVTFFGRTSEPEKLRLMQAASVLVVTSVKEGWGLIVTEANSMGTPAIVYDVDGLRAAAGSHNWMVPPRPERLGARLLDARRLFDSRHTYDEWCTRVLDDSRAYTHDASYADFSQVLSTAVPGWPHG
jgi:glycosyltransferase involved in cell wall biosynthesis